MTPYLVNSPEEIYTTTKKASEITITVGGYTEPGTLAFAEGQERHGATLTEAGTSTDPNPDLEISSMLMSLGLTIKRSVRT